MGPTTAASMTPQGQATSSLQNVLSQITGMAQQAPVDPSTAVSNTFTNASSAAEVPAVQQATQQLTQQSGIPALQQSQNNLGSIFQMYLADQNLAQKYSAPSLTQGNSPVYGSGLQGQAQNLPGLTPGNQTLGNNPYLASPNAIVNAIMQPQGQGFQGFTAPAQNTSAMGVVPSSASGLSSELSSLIGSEQGLVNTQVGNYQTQYQGIMDTLNSLLSNQAATSFSTAQPGSAQSLQKSLNSLQSDVNKGMTLTQLIQKYATDPNMTADKVYQMYNAKHSQPGDKWGPAKESATQLADLGITGAPVTQAGKNKYQAKKLPNGDLANYDPSTGKYYDPNTGKQLPVTSTELQAAQGTANIAQQMMDSYQNMNIAERGAIALGGAGLVSHISPDYAAAQSQLYQSLGNLRKGSIGGRITQQEIQWLTQKLFPSPLDTKATMQSKVDQLNKAVTRLISDPNSHVNSDGTVSSSDSSTSSSNGKTVQIGKYQVSY